MIVKCFNTEGVCLPELHYMVNVNRQLNEIKMLVDAGKYFTINRARQYGKTTTIRQLVQMLSEEYIVFSLSFEGMGDFAYKEDSNFCKEFSGLLCETIDYGETKGVPQEIYQMLAEYANGDKQLSLREFSNVISQICKESVRPMVLIIDEVDYASGKPIFLDFLGMLRNKYLKRTDRPTFHSVILAGVHDIKNLKLKMRSESERQYNSPWNIAADFNVDMSLSTDEIAGMLQEYEDDWHTGMDIMGMAKMIFDYTSGYPYLVSRLCKIIDERIANSEVCPDKQSAWTKSGFLEAERLLLQEKNTLFESLINKLSDYPEMDEMLYALLFSGRGIAYNALNPAIEIASMFGFVKNRDGMVEPANRIFDTLLYNYYLSANEMHDKDIYKASLKDKNQFIIGGHLNMRLILEKFVAHFTELYADSDETFLEEEGRKYFLLYLRPIINGVGNYYIESRTRGMRRTDVIVDYRGEQSIVEMKIWHGEEYNRRGEEQLAVYLDDYQKNKGYMISFNFNKNKQVGVHEVFVKDKILIEAVV